MSIDPNMKFARSLKGYSPKEVDAAFDLMQAEILSLQEENAALKNTLELCDERIRQLIQSTMLLNENI